MFDTVYLTRIESAKDGVFGYMKLPTGETLCTVEDDWLFNRRRVSAIPVGMYYLERTIYHRHQIETFEVTDVPDRSRILVHVANTEEDVEGCIGVGLAFGYFNVYDEDDPKRPRVKKKGVSSSKIAFDHFMNALQMKDRWPFVVRWDQNVPVPVT